MYFPRLVVPLSITLSNMIKLGIQFLLFFAVYVWFFLQGCPFHPNWALALVPLLIVMLGALGLGFGMIISSLTTKYRDLRFLISFGVQLWMYATPVIYPLSVLKQNYPQYVWVMAANPLTSVLETFRYAFTGVGVFDLGYLLYSTLFTFSVLLLGILIFNKVQRNFMDVI